MGFYIDTTDNLYTGFISYNFSKFNQYWYIRNDLNGKNTSVVIANLEKGIQKLREAGFKPIINPNETESSPTENVFLYNLIRMLNEIRNILIIHPSHIKAYYVMDKNFSILDGINNIRTGL